MPLRRFGVIPFLLKMSGFQKIDGVVGAMSGTPKTVSLGLVPVANTAVLFLIDILTIAGTWDVIVSCQLSFNSFPVASITDLSLSGVYVFSSMATYGSPWNSLPSPTLVSYVNTSPGSLTADIWMCYS